MVQAHQIIKCQLLGYTFWWFKVNFAQLYHFLIPINGILIYCLPLTVLLNKVSDVNG